MNTFQTRSAKIISGIVKKVSRNLEVVVGGPHPSALKLDIFNYFPDVDIVVYGEGEETFLDIVDGKNLANINGICYENNINPPRPPITDFAYIPLTNLDLVGGAAGIKRFTGASPKGPFPSMFIMASRGCFGHCTFCNTPVFWGSKIRTRKPEALIREIEWLSTKYGIKEIFFQDDTFNANKAWAETVLNLIVKKKLNKDIKYKLCFRANKALVTPDLLSLAKKANVWLIFYGVENGNPDMLKKIKKGIAVEDIERAFRLTRKAGIKTTASFMIGNQGETEDTVRESISLAKRIKPYGLGFSIAVPFPETELRRHAIENGNLLIDDYELYGPDKVLLRTESLTGEDIKKLHHSTLLIRLLLPSCFNFILRPKALYSYLSLVFQKYAKRSLCYNKNRVSDE